MMYSIESSWKTGKDCLETYGEQLKPFSPVVKERWEQIDSTHALKIETLYIQIKNLTDLQKLIHRVGESIIISEDNDIEIYDDYRE